MTVEEAFAKKTSDQILVAKGEVVDLLPDEHHGSPHQRFVIEVHSKHTILVINNIEHGYKIPVKLGDVVEVKGSYVWNKYGGLIHETHHHLEGESHVDGYITLVK